MVNLQPRLKEAIEQQQALIMSAEQRLKWAAGANPALCEVYRIYRVPTLLVAVDPSGLCGVYCLLSRFQVKCTVFLTIIYNA